MEFGDFQKAIALYSQNPPKGEPLVTFDELRRLISNNLGPQTPKKGKISLNSFQTSSSSYLLRLESWENVLFSSGRC